MKTLAVRLPTSLYRKVELLARSRKTSKTEIARQALDAATATQPVHRLSAYDLAEDVIGALDGPADLSSNRQYLDKYGE